MADPAIQSMHDLLRSEGWLRALAARIAGASDAEDVVQDTFVAALASAPREPGRLRPWLATVARNFALRRRRGSRRRATHERAAARPEALPAVDATLARLALARRLTEAVSALPEPYRATLLWHFHDGLTAQAIAARGGTTEVAVRKRIERGLAMLRSRLAGELGDDWRAALAPLLPVPGAFGGKGALLAFACAALLGAASVAWPTRTRAHVTFAADENARHVAPGALRSAPPIADAPPPARTVVVAHRVRILAPDGRPISGLDVRIAGRQARTDADGCVPLAGESDGRSLQSDGHLLLQAGTREEGDVREAVFVLARARRLPCTVLDEHRRPLADVACAWRVRTPDIEGLAPLPGPEPVREGGARLDGSTGANEDACVVPAVALALRFTKDEYAPRTVELADDGTIRSEDAAESTPDGWPRAWLVDDQLRAGLPIGERPHAWFEGERLHVVLDRAAAPACRIAGRVVGADGAPVAGAFVGIHADLATTSGDEGAFVLDVGAGRMPRSPVLVAAKPGLRAAVVDLAPRLQEAPRGPIEIELLLGGEPLAIRGRVVDEHGKPCAGLLVFPWQSEDLGAAGTPEDLSLPPDAPSFSLGLNVRRAIACTGPDGRFTVPGLLDRPYRLRVCAATSWLVCTTAPVRAGSDVEIVLSPQDCDLAVAGTVRDPHGTPLADVEVALAYTTDETTAGQCGGVVELGRTDRTGRFAVRHAMRAASLRFRKPGHAQRTIDLAPWSGADLDVTLGALCELQLEGDLTWRSIEFRDAQGAVIDVLDDDPHFLRRRTRLSIGPDGRTEPVSVDELATAVALLGRDGRLVTRPIRLVAGRRNVVRL